MRKSLLFLLFACLASAVFAQKTSLDNKPSVVNDQIKAALVSELSLASDVADRVVLIEDDFFNQVTAIKALKETAIKEKAKIRDAIIIRRNKLSAVPLAPRQMEDVMMIVENIRRKQTSK